MPVDADLLLPSQLRAIARFTAEPILQPIYDLESALRHFGAERLPTARESSSARDLGAYL